MATNEVAEAETSRDTAEGDAFLVEWDGGQMYALACVKRGRVRFRTAQNDVLPTDAKVISRLTPAPDSNELKSDAAIVEWKGERFHSLAFIKHGKRFYRLADGRSLGRATFVAGLADPAAVETRYDTAGNEGDWTVRPAEDSVLELALPGTPRPQEYIQQDSPLAQEPSTTSSGPADETGNVRRGTARRPAPTGHWSDAVVEEPARTHLVATPMTTPAALEHPMSSAERPAPVDELRPPATKEVQFDGHRWQGVTADGGTVTVWEGPARLAEVDAELAAAEERVRHLTELRRMIDGDREQAIAEHVARFAEIDGIHDLADATETQRATWRRYAEGVVGD